MRGSPYLHVGLFDGEEKLQFETLFAATDAHPFSALYFNTIELIRLRGALCDLSLLGRDGIVSSLCIMKNNRNREAKGASCCLPLPLRWHGAVSEQKF